MRHPNLAIILILIGALCFAAGWTWALVALCVVIVLLPCKYDPAIQAKMQRDFVDSDRYRQ